MSLRCSSCRHESGPSARFCEQCGARLGASCVACGAELSASARFCASCGARVEGEAPPAPAARIDSADRRQVTVMFCDLVDSTALSQRLDPEDLRDLLRRYHDTCTAEISRVGGYIAQYLGDGVLAYFGYPIAREQDAQAAVRAGLAIVEKMERSSEQAGAVRLAVRVGIHSGLVVAGEIGTAAKRERIALGGAPNVAARVQSLARPGRVVISETTQRLVEGIFAGTDLGPQEMKGVAAPMRVFEVSGLAPAHNRLETRSGRRLTPLTARDLEVQHVETRWGRAAGGESQLVLVSGEAGVGKSRLLQELQDALAGTPHVHLDCHCSPFFESSALFPVIELLQRLLGLNRLDSAEDRSAAIEAVVSRFAPGDPQRVPLLAELLSLPAPANAPALDLTPQVRKQRTFEALIAVLLGIAEQEPVLLVVEDLHWIDPSTLELLRLLVERAKHARLLILLLFRPTFESPWAVGGHVSRISLERLSREQTEAMIEHVAGGPLPNALVDELCQKVDGVPFYIEELTQMVLESGALTLQAGAYQLARPLEPLAIPLTLQASLMARLDRLAPLREVVQLGATIGRSFRWDLIRSVSHLDEGELRDELAQLVDAGVLHQSGSEDELEFVFKHALIQDAAYESLLKGRRRDYHLRIAETLADRFQELSRAQPELLGHHWAGAQRSPEAIACFLEAGRRSYQRSAYAEAANHLRRGLGLLEGIGDSTQRARAELELLIALGPVLVGTLGYSNPEVERVYARARELTKEVGETPRLVFTVLSGLLLFHQSRAELRACVELTDERMRIARRLGDVTLEMQAHENYGTVATWRGEHATALVSLRAALERYTPEGGRALRLVYGTDTAVVSKAYEGHALFYLGRPDAGKQRSRDAVAAARELGHGHSLALALCFYGQLLTQRGECDEALEILDEARTLSETQQLAQWIGTSVVNRGIALSRLGRADEGIELMIRGTAAFSATGARIAGRMFVTELCQAHGRAGKAARGLELLGVMLPLVSKEDVYYDAEVQRVHGELWRAVHPDDVEGARTHFEAAIDIARAQDSLAFELRAAVALARLEFELGQPRAALARLRPLHARFDEGLATADLLEAGALLAELTQESARPA